MGVMRICSLMRCCFSMARYSRARPHADARARLRCVITTHVRRPGLPRAAGRWPGRLVDARGRAAPGRRFACEGTIIPAASRAVKASRSARGHPRERPGGDRCRRAAARRRAGSGRLDTRCPAAFSALFARTAVRRGGENETGQVAFTMLNHRAGKGLRSGAVAPIAPGTPKKLKEREPPAGGWRITLATSSERRRGGYGRPRRSSSDACGIKASNAADGWRDLRSAGG